MLKTEVIGSRTYLTYHVEDENELDNFGFQMISQNTIEGLLGFSTIVKDDMQVLRYDISSKVTLGQYMDGVLRKKNILNVLKSILTAMKSVQEYMLLPEYLQLGLDEIYVNVTDGNCRLMYIPVAEMEESTDLVSFFKNIITNIKYDNSDGNGYITDILTFLNFHQQLDVEEFYMYIANLSEKEKLAKTVTKNTTPAPEPIAAQAQVSPSSVVAPQQANVAPSASSGLKGEVNYPEVPLNYEEEISKVGKAAVEIPQVPPVQQEEKKKGLFGGLKASKKPVASEKPIIANSKIKEEAKEKPISTTPRFAIPKTGDSSSASSGGFAIPGVPDAPSPRSGSESPISSNPNAERKMDIPKKNASRVIGTKRPPAVEPIASAPVVQEIPQMPVQQEIPSVGRSVDFGNTVYVSSDDEEDNSTVILGSDNMVNVSINNGHPCIVRVKNKQKMYLDKPILKIGREASYVDFYIGDNSHVGRTHADIITKEDGYYIRDNNSSNHTFINGVQIAAGQLVKLQFNDKIALGDEEFVFMQN